ncbi:MAG TPA: fumarylacetoacetate hydrolase family protein [Xanthobacteraceae bacterium]|nr:fumarylacetoacetate hydrolase family protein [Xanthobacteraceae bacterium]
MKIVGFTKDDGLRIGVIEGNEVVDVQAVDPSMPNDLGAVLREHNGDLQALADIANLAPSSARRPFAGLRYALPVARPGKIICLGLNYLEHVKEGPNAANVPKFPTLFARGLNSVVPHEYPLTRPRVSETFDYEAEMVVVIGKRAKHMALENALSCVAGFTCANEGSIREFQRHTTQWHMGKNFDNSGSIGPWVVTADELPPGGKGLRIESRINGKVMQSDNTANMMFPVAETIVYATQGITLEPGDLLLTGTPSGVGHARKPPAWMRNGDVCEIEIEGIGILRNPVEDEKA